MTAYNVFEYNTKSTGGQRQYRNYSVNKNYSAYGLSSAYGEYYREMQVSVDIWNSAPKYYEGQYASIGSSSAGYNKCSAEAAVLSYGGINLLFYIRDSVCSYTTYYRYRDRSKVYTYYFSKVEAKESSTAVSPSDTVSNVQEWVKYISK